MKPRLLLTLALLALLAPALHEWVDTTLFVRANRGHCAEVYARGERCLIVRVQEVSGE